MIPYLDRYNNIRSIGVDKASEVRCCSWCTAPLLKHSRTPHHISTLPSAHTIQSQFQFHHRSTPWLSSIPAQPSTIQRWLATSMTHPSDNP
ncbi:hypothetical protein L873DRAFT_1800144 [Choiromyces venosus 120613-1]|uniref:Uncharacterized protein n=1 Tax=Choiromyces venosus 120613-1 TaxID=1336337 RepID=A0A3N4KCJ0_9PEZI|nr:hypothetical protein L873DRAFT_1800144 [Choiromyces venosus 120613-1]